MGREPFGVFSDPYPGEMPHMPRGRSPVNNAIVVKDQCHSNGT